jgi:His/Glu/Gln/Arg/opine family amino acid ABC transporter permease subunit
MQAEESIWGLLAYGDNGWGDEFVRGVSLTIQLSLCSYVVGFGFGLLGAGAKLSANKWLNRIGDLYTTIIRALPELLLLLIIYYSGTTALRKMLLASGLFSSDIEIPAFAAAVASLGFIYGAYMTEVLRGAILSIHKGQSEAARAFGMGGALRFRRIIFPQMMRFALPGLGNQWLNITKDSALISVLGAFAETLLTGKIAASETKEYLFFYSVSASLFLCLTVVSMIVVHQLEKRVSRGVRRA